jgi:hypothetical protein
MKYCISTYDEQLLSAVEHFRRYPEMLPFLGSDYEKNNIPRILLVAESHYLPDGSTIHLDPSDWHKGNNENLSEEERRWINTRGILHCGKNQVWKAKGHTIYRHIEQVLLKAGLPHRENMFEYVAFMNFFTRPAIYKGSFKDIATKKDIDHSKNVFEKVIRIINPEMVCVVSTYSWRYAASVLSNLEVKSQHTAHPASHWWNRKSKFGTGRDRMLSFLESNICFKENS